MGHITRSTKFLPVLIVLLTILPTASAIDINSSRALQYYGNGDALDFQVGTSGNTDIYGALDLNTNAISNADWSNANGLNTDGQVIDTECSNDDYLGGDGTCYADSDTADDQNLQDVLNYGNSAGAYGINMNGNSITSVGSLNVTDTDTGTPIANFTSTGVNMYQPLSIQSSGPLSVANGVDLTGTSTNTIDSYSTMYLQTSSGSPTDIVLDPTGVVGADSDLDMGLNDVDNVGSGGLGHVDIGTGTGSDPGITIQDTDDGKDGHLQLAGGGNIVIRDDTGANSLVLPNDGTQDVQVPNGNLDLSGGTNKLKFDSSHFRDKIVLYEGGDEKIGTQSNEMTFQASKFGFYEADGSTKQLFIDSNDNVDIPNGNLWVDSGDTVSDSPGLTIEDDSQSTLAFDNSGTQVSHLRADNNGNLILSMDDQNGGGGDFYFRKDDGGSGSTDLFHITNSGNVGIGTSSPDNALDVTGGNLDMNGNNIQLGNSGGTGTATVEGFKNLYAGDETEVTTDSGSYVTKKELTMVFDENIGQKPDYINVVVRLKNAYAQVTVDGNSKEVSTTSDSYVMKTMNFDVSGFSDDSTHPVTLDIKTNGGTAYQDIVEFYYVD